MRDQDVRRAVRRRLDAQHAGDRDTRVVEEMGIWSGSVRVDLAVINGELTGFEIKSDRDTLNRLHQQCELYCEVFDRVCLVAAPRHLEKACKIVPTWWGLSSAYDNEVGNVIIHDHRRALLNPQVNLLQVARLLWRDEAIELLAQYSLLKGYKSKTAEVLHARLAAELPPTLLRHSVRAFLKKRSGWLGEQVRRQREMTI